MVGRGETSKATKNRVLYEGYKPIGVVKKIGGSKKKKERPQQEKRVKGQNKSQLLPCTP